MDQTVNAQGGILMPGMINTHSHISMIPFRSMGDNCPDRLRKFLFPLELEAMTPELVYRGARYGICELLLSGVTTITDMYYFEEGEGGEPARRWESAHGSVRRLLTSRPAMRRTEERSLRAVRIF
ncbi:MAG: amidohydrolase family protein [Lachnospiraceae bacterium]